METLTNESFVKDALAKAGLDASKHMIAVTSETSPLAKSDDYLAAFFMDDYIGGRYSSTSAVGGAVLSLAFGPEVFAQFLDGAAAEDKLSKNADIMENPEMLDALIGVLREKTYVGYPSTAVLHTHRHSAVSLHIYSRLIWSQTASRLTVSVSL